jgi:hypothetical protein
MVARSERYRARSPPGHPPLVIARIATRIGPRQEIRSKGLAGVTFNGGAINCGMIKRSATAGRWE